MIDHDRLFKALLTTFFIEFIELFFPDVAGYLKPDSVTFLDKELFTDIPGGERREADVVVRTQFRDRPAFFLIHVEHQAEAQAEFSRRMFHYFTRLYEKYALPVYPIVLFSYDTPIREEPTAHRVAFPDLTVLDFTYRVVQLNRLSWRDFVRQPNPVASALMAKKERVMQLTTSWKEEGLQEGLQQGEANLILRQIARRFGTADRQLETRIRALAVEQLEALGEALFDFAGLADVAAWLDRQTPVST